MKKILAGMLAGAMVFGALTGCSGGNKETQAPAAEGTATTAAAEASSEKEADSGEIKTLDVVWFSDGKEGESFMKLAGEYMEDRKSVV